MTDTAIDRHRRQPVRQFSVFTENRTGRLHDIIELFMQHDVHVLAVTALDTTDAAILRMVLDDPDLARSLLREHQYPFAECDLLVVEVDSERKLPAALFALLEAEVNIHYLYPFIVQPGGRSALALSVEDMEVAIAAMRQRQIRVLFQSDILR